MFEHTIVSFTIFTIFANFGIFMLGYAFVKKCLGLSNFINKIGQTVGFETYGIIVAIGKAQKVSLVKPSAGKFPIL
jgi:hypothetical protein